MNISQVQIQLESSESTRIHSENGTLTERSSVSESMEDNDYTMYLSSNENGSDRKEIDKKRKRNPKGSTSSTVGSHQQNKKTTYSVKSKIYRHPTQGFKYFLTQDPESTLNEKISKGFFTQSCSEMSEKLWYPTKTDCVELHSTSSNGYVENTKLNSWFTTKIRRDPMKRNSWRTSWPSPTFSVPGSMEKDQISQGNAIQKGAKNKIVVKLMIVQLKILARRKDTNVEIAKKLLDSFGERISVIQEWGKTQKMSKSQKTQIEILECAMVDYISGNFDNSEDIGILFQQQEDLSRDLLYKLKVTENHTKRANNIRVLPIDPVSKSRLRKNMVASRKIFNTAVHLSNILGDSGKETTLRDRCVRTKFVNDDLKNISEHVRQKAFDKFSSSKNSCTELGGRLGFISRKKDTSWVGFQKRDCVVKDDTLFIHKGKNQMVLRLGENVEDGEPECDIEVTESFGIFKVRFTYIHQFVNQMAPDIKTSRVCALDMGERTFGTLYDPDGTIAFLGTDANDKVKSRLRVIYKLRNGLKTKLTRNKRIRILKACKRASAKLRNLIKEMHNRLANWLVSNYDLVLIGKLGIGVMKAKRKGKKVLQSMSHYSFRQTLLQRASKNGCSVRVVSEAYTTKQCNKCGYMNLTIGSSEEFSCRNCKVVCHRDVHSGRGIFLRSVSRDVASTRG